MRARWMMWLVAMGCGEAGSYAIDPPLPEQPRLGAPERTGSVAEPRGARVDVEVVPSLGSVCVEACDALAACRGADQCLEDCLALPITQSPECLQALLDLDLCIAQECRAGPGTDRCWTQETVEFLQQCRAFG